ncbi:MAG: WG repeat-containing protein [Bacteroidia bacterium]
MKREQLWTSLTVGGLLFAGILTQGCGGKTDSNGNTNPDSTQGNVTEEQPVDSNTVVYVGDTSEGMIRFKTEANLYGFFTDKGDTVVKPKYSLAFDFKDGWAKIGINGKQGFVDKTGAEVIPPTYDKATAFYEDLAGVLVDGKWGFIDRANKMAIPAQYMEVQNFSEGVCPIKTDSAKYWTYIDKKGKVVIGEQMKLESAWPFSEGLAHGMKENLWGFFNHSGKVVVPFEYFNVGPFQDGSAPAQKPEYWIRIDKKGKCVMNCDGAMEGAQVSGGDGQGGHEGHDHGDHEGHDHEH